MRLYHEGDRAPNGGHFSAADEEDCYADGGMRRGIWLTTEPLAGPAAVAVEISAAQIAEYEITGAGADHRSFIVPHGAISDVAVSPPQLA